MLSLIASFLAPHGSYSQIAYLHIACNLGWIMRPTNPQSHVCERTFVREGSGFGHVLYDESVMVAVDSGLCRDFSHFITLTSEFDLLTDLSAIPC